MKKLTLVLALANVLVACKASNPSLTPNAISYAPPIERMATPETADGISVTIDQRVDILFEFDNSDSMNNHNGKVAKNVRMFLDEIARNKNIDFHIAYTTVHDRTLDQVCLPGTDRAGEKNFDDPGTLGPLLGNAPADRRYLTRDDDFVGVLEETMKNGLKVVYVEKNPATPNVCARGPENEESFLPITEALENRKLLDGPNKGFRRPGAKFVAIMVSDAKDAAIATGKTDLDTVYRKIMNATGSTEDKRKARVFAVVIKPGSVPAARGEVSFGGHTCKMDPAFALSSIKVQKGLKLVSLNKWSSAPIGEKENPLARLAQMTEDEGPDRIDQTISICDPDYGTDLAKFGTRIQRDAIEDLAIPLKKIPQVRNAKGELTKLKVTLGGVDLGADQWAVQMINGVSNVVIFAKSIDWTQVPRGTKIGISYVAVDPNEATSKAY